MTPDFGDFSELQDLLELLCEGRAEPAHFVRIQQLAQSSGDAMQFYVDYLDQHARLMWRFRRFAAESFTDPAPCASGFADAAPVADPQAGSAFSSLSDKLPAGELRNTGGNPPPPSAGASSAAEAGAIAGSPGANNGAAFALSFVSDCFQHVVGVIGSHLVLLAFVAATSCFAATWLLFGPKPIGQLAEVGHGDDQATLVPGDSSQNPNDSANADRSSADEPPPVVIARITDSHQARWQTKAGVTDQPPALAVGNQLNLSAGLVEMTFDNGAQVLLEGPAKLVLDSPMRATLLFGQLTANIPTPAIGFTIETPMVNVVDLGTEFGVRVSQKGMTDVAVFSGKVVASPRQAGSDPPPAIRVVADEVRRFWSGSIVDEEPLAAPNFTLSIPKQVPIANASFESPQLDGWLQRAATGWSIVSEPVWQGRLNGGVQLAHADRVQLPTPPDGRQWGFIETRKAPGGGAYQTSIYQAVGKLAPKTMYRLKVTIGYEGYTTHGIQARYPFSWDGQDGFEIGLWSGAGQGGGPNQPLKVVHNPVPTLCPCNTETVTLTYYSPAELTAGEDELFVRMSLKANDWCRVLFDDVQLEAVPIGNSWASKPGASITGLEVLK